MRWQILALGWALAMLAGVVGCDSPARVVISVGKLPPGSTTLVAQLRVGSSQYEATPRFAVDSAALGGEGRYTFGLRLHDRKSGQLSVYVAALSESSSGSSTRLCLLATEVGQVTILDAGEATLSLDLNRQVFDGSACNSDLPIIARASQQLIDGRIRLAVDGFGFAPQTALLFDGAPQPFVSNDSPLQLTSELPIIMAPSGALAVKVQTQLPSGPLSNAVSYVAAEPWFDSPAEPVARGSSDALGIPIYTAATTADFNGDKLPDLAVIGYYDNGTRRGSAFVDVFLGNGRGLSANRRTSAVWTNTLLADPANISATAVVSSVYRKNAKTDLIVAINDASSGRGGFVVLNNDGRGYFTPQPVFVLDTAFVNPSQIAHVDVNPLIDPGANPDVVLLTTRTNGNSLMHVFLSDINGNIGTVLFWNIGVGRRVSGWSPFDLNADSAIDFSFVGENANSPGQAQVHTVLNYRDGKIFRSFSDGLNTCNIAGFGGAVLVRDWFGNNRGSPVASSVDLTSNRDASVQVIHSRETLTMHPADAPPNPPAEPGLFPSSLLYRAGVAPLSLAAVDGDRDGAPDLAAALRGDATQPTRLVILRNNRPANDTDPLFPSSGARMDALPTLTLWGETGDAFLLTDDINRDTQPDLIAVVRGDAASSKPGSVWLFRSQ